MSGTTIENGNGGKLFVANIPWGSSDRDLAAHFEQCGEVLSARIAVNDDTGRSRGFGFVEMGSAAEARAAVERLNGREMDGRKLDVQFARPKDRH